MLEGYVRRIPRRGRFALDLDMARPLLTALLLAASLLVPATASADGSLLSGYGGPGGGEQVVLGSKLLPGGSSGGRGLRDRGPRPPAVRSTALPAGGPAAGLPRLAAAPASASTPATTRGSGTPGHAPASQGRHTSATTSTPGAGGGLKAVQLGAPSFTAASHAGDAGGPFDGTDLLILALGAGVLVLTALGTGRLVAAADGREPGSTA